MPFCSHAWGSQKSWTFFPFWHSTLFYVGLACSCVPCLLSLLALAPFSLLLQVLLVFLAQAVFIFHSPLPLSAQWVPHLLPLWPLNGHFLFSAQYLCLPSGPNNPSSSDLLFFVLLYTQNYDMKPTGWPSIHQHIYKGTSRLTIF